MTPPNPAVDTDAAGWASPAPRSAVTLLVRRCKRLIAAIANVLIVIAPSVAFGQTTLAERVSALVSDTLVPEKEAQAFAGLEALGVEAVPYIVGHLGDVRVVPVQRISLVNKSSKAFEGRRQYAPQTVHDALSAILNQVTGEHFEVVYNGASEATRVRNRERWRLWCVRVFPAQAAVCNGGAQPRVYGDRSRPRIR